MKEVVQLHQKGKDPLFRIWHASGKPMLMYVHRGDGVIVCREKTYPLKEGVLCFVGGERRHYTMPEKPERYDRSKVHFPSVLLNNLEAAFQEDDTVLPKSEEDFIYAQLEGLNCEKAEKLFEELRQSENEPFAEATQIACIIHLLILLRRYASETVSPPKNPLEIAMEYINKNIYQALTVEKICNAAHVSKYHFCRKFKEKTGLTVMEYVLKTRLLLAKDLLKKETASVAEISERCGFSSISYFCRIFKEETGKTPLAYRKKQKNP